MKVYNKRIAFLLSDQHFIPHGGIGSFCKGFTEMCNRVNWKVDIILDKAPRDTEFEKLIISFGANIRYSKKTLRYSNHTATFAFSDSINFEKIVNFRNSLLEAFHENIYDMIVCNTQEAMTAVYALSISQYIPVVFYTHLHSMIFRNSQGSDVFLDSYHNFYNKHMEFSDVIIGTQSQKNIDELTKYGATNCKLLRMPMSERGLLERYTGKREGVLFIGRWEEGKNPEAYIRVMKECGLPCRVMTNESGLNKFEKAFADAGISNYTIKAGIIGKEKVDFICGSKTFFMPSLRENYPFAFLECLSHMPCVVLDTQDWSDNFDSQYFHKVNIKNASKLIKTIYDDYQLPSALDYVKNLDDEVTISWVKFLDNFVGKYSNTNTAKINNYNTVKYRDYITDLNREHLAREDFESVLSNKNKYCKIVYTDDNTYLSKDLNFIPKPEEVVSINLFEGLL